MRGFETGPAEPEAPSPRTERLPWSAREQLDLAQAEPPRPLSLSADLTPEDVEQIQSAAVGRKLSFPIALAVIGYFALKAYLGDQVPDVLLYVLIGGTFVFNTLLGMRKNKNHYAQPGRITMTLSADGVEVSAEHWAGHVPWVLVDRFSRSDTMTFVQTANQPSFHALPVAQLSDEQLRALDVWIQYAAGRRQRRSSRALVYVALIGAALLGGIWLWDSLGRPLPDLPPLPR